MAENQEHQPAHSNDIPPYELRKMMKSSLYDATFTTWMNTKLEADKTIVAVSSAGIGLLVTLLGSIEINTRWELNVYRTALVMFCIAIGCGVFIFYKNAKAIGKTIDEEVKTHIIRVPVEQEASPRSWWRKILEKYLALADGVMMLSFFVGVILTACVGISASCAKYAKSKTVDQKNISVNTIQVGSISVKQLTYSTAKTKGGKSGRRNPAKGPAAYPERCPEECRWYQQPVRYGQPDAATGQQHEQPFNRN